MRRFDRPVFVRRSRQGGFTLIEVMVAIVILSFGLLGVAGLMVNGLQFTHSAQQRAAATQLAYDMIDRMRSNQAAASLPDNPAGGGNYHRPSANVTGSGSPYIIQKAACVGSIGAPSGNCGPGDMADQDSWEWQQAIAQRLGSGVGIVCRDSSNTTGTFDPATMTVSDTGGCNGIGPRYAIKIYWVDDRSNNLRQATVSAFQVSFIP